MNKIYFLLFLVSLAILGSFPSCYQSPPPVFDPNLAPIDSGDIFFSGYGWRIKASGFPVGPGPNFFSGSDKNVWIDANGYLHLKITKEGTQWRSAEVISTANMGYGTYVFTLANDVSKLNEKAVLGLFTWDDSTFYEQANSEIDIEFSRWNNASDSLLLTYSAQPVIFDNPVMYFERSYHPQMKVSALKTNTTHAFTWKSNEVTWASYAGDNFPGTSQLANWRFDTSNQPRTKIEGGKTSLPIIVPAPGKTTNARMNLWLLGGQAPSDGKDIEVVIKSFKYTPL
ncbi:MAG: hypothetical protein ACKVTZ_06800 [Bacteroidia bacterium]